MSHGRLVFQVQGGGCRSARIQPVFCCVGKAVCSGKADNSRGIDERAVSMQIESSVLRGGFNDCRQIVAARICIIAEHAGCGNRKRVVFADTVAVRGSRRPFVFYEYGDCRRRAF